MTLDIRRDALALLDLAIDLKAALRIPAQLQRLAESDNELRTELALLRPRELTELKRFITRRTEPLSAHDVREFLSRNTASG